MESHTVKDFSKIIKDKRDFYEALRRNGWYLPAYKCSMMNEIYMIGVMEGSTYCPKFEEIRLKACPRSPHKDVLVKKFLQIMRTNEVKVHGLDDDHLPDKQWLIDVISTLKPEDEIFKKDYMPPPRKNTIEEQKTIMVPESFLLNLPDSRSKAKARRLKVTGEGMAKQRISYLKQAVKDLNVSILNQEMKAEAYRQKQKSRGTEGGPSKPQFKSPARNSGNSSKKGILNSSAAQPQASSMMMQTQH